MNKRRGIIVAVLSGLLFVGPPIALAANGSGDDTEQVNRVLKQMSTAVRELNYRGLFTYEVGGSLDTYQIIHRVSGNTEYERLFKLNGAEREVLRSGQTTNCLSQGDKLLRGLLRPPQISSNLRDNYHFYLTGDERVAGRPTVVVQVVPKDEHRFGYTLGIDKQSGLPLKSMRVSTGKRIMERIQFIDLSVGAEIGDPELNPLSEQHNQAAHDLIDCRSTSTAEQPAWQPNWLPAGFVYSGQRETETGDHMLTYTDGLATFSIFVGRANARAAIEGRAQIGATVAYVNQRVWNGQPHSVTVVGEIPFATAQQVVAALEPRQ
ncbi:MAG: MucB/RseB C-terminal domain-containing protein [Cellvibrionaceae bacterium]